MINVYTDGLSMKKYGTFIDECVVALFAEEVAYEDHEIASNIAHELVHAKQFCRGQINMIDNVWKHNKQVIDCDHVDYMDTPWEVEAYGYESILTDLLWENV